MSSERAVRSEIEIMVEKIGGIDETRATFQPGITILAGRNATNRTSLLQAIMASMGSERASLKADAEEGSVTLTVHGDTYERHLRRQNGTVVTSGDTYLDDPEVGDLFAFLLKDNEVRRAVERNEDLRELIMRPVDTAAIQAEIEDLTAEKQQLQARLEELDDLERRLPDLEAERTEFKDRLEDKKAELAEKEAEIDTAEGSLEETRETKVELDEKFDELRETRSELEDVRYDLETERESLKSLQEDRAEITEELESLSETPVGEIQSIDARLDALHDRKQALSADISRLQNIVQFNEEMLEGTDTELLSALTEDDGSGTNGSVTDQLVGDSGSITCWTCGSTVETEQVSSILEQLRELQQSKLEERSGIDDEIQSLRSEKQDLERQQQKRDRLEQKLRQRETEIERSKGTIENLEARREELTERVESLEETVEDLEEQEYTELLDLHKEANQLEFEVEQLESDLADVQVEIDSIEDRLDDREELQERRTEVQDELEGLRTKIEQIEERAIEEFNDHMDTLLDLLDYDNIERIWIERIERETRRGNRKSTEGAFELHVVRATESGAVYEDTVSNLSESEREVTGLVFAFAGYLAHEVHEQVPFLLLDSLESIDAERIDTLVNYLEDVGDYIVVALLPEDAAELDDEYRRLTDI